MRCIAISIGEGQVAGLDSIIIGAVLGCRHNRPMKTSLKKLKRKV